MAYNVTNSRRWVSEMQSKHCSFQAIGGSENWRFQSHAASAIVEIFYFEQHTKTPGNWRFQGFDLAFEENYAVGAASGKEKNIC